MNRDFTINKPYFFFLKSQSVVIPHEESVPWKLLFTNQSLEPGHVNEKKNPPESYALMVLNEIKSASAVVCMSLCTKS